MYCDRQCMERTPEEGTDVTYSRTFRFHSPYLSWMGGKGILAGTLIRSKEVHEMEEKKELRHWKYHGLPLVAWLSR